jgi:hypothetical protein
MPIVVRQLVFPCPPRDLIRLPVRPSIAILPTSIAFVKETLIVALQLVVQDNAVHSSALLAKAILGTEVRAIDLRVVRQLARLSETGVERLAWLVVATALFVAVGFEKVSAALRQDDRSVVRAKRAPPDEPFVLQMPHVSTRADGLITWVVKIALGQHAKRSDCPKHAAFVAVDLVDAIAVADRAPLSPARQVDIAREDAAVVAHVMRVAVIAAATTGEAAFQGVAAVAAVVT